MNSMLFTQVHCLRDGHVLLMRRNKEPNLGLWVAPGGKLEKDEAPYECAIRELREETGLQAHELVLRGIVSCVAAQIEQPCMQFLFTITDFSGELEPDEQEGSLAWWPAVDALRLPMPPANAAFLPRVLDPNGSFYQAKHVYDADWRLIQIVEHTDRVLPQAYQRSL